MKKIYVFILAFFIGFGYSDNIDVKVVRDYNTAWNYYYYKIKITALEDGIQIKDVKVNNGNCKKLVYEGAHIRFVSSTPPKEPLNLGEVLNVRLLPECNPIKVEVDTNKGSWVWNFEP